MSAGPTDIYPLLSVAINMEREDQEIYSTYADAASNIGLTRLLKTMVEIKNEHERRLKELELFEPLPLMFEPCDDAPRPADFVSSAEFDPEMAHPELLLTAVEREGHAAELYGHLCARARHEDIRILLARLADEERKLMRWAQDLLELFELTSD